MKEKTSGPDIGILPWVICGLAAVFYAYEFLLRISPNVMVPELMRAFSISATQLGVFSAFYYYAYNPMQIPVGMVMDFWGPKKVMTIAVMLCALGTLMIGYTDELWIAQIGRFLTGFGSAFAFVGVLKLASIWLPPNRFAFISGLTTTLGFLGAGFGNAMLTPMVQTVGWNGALIYSAYFGFFLVPVMWLILKDGNSQKKFHRSELAWNNFIALLKDVWKVLSNKQILLNGVIGGLIMLPTTVFGELWGQLYLSKVHGFSAQDSANAVTMLFVGWAVGAPIMGIISDRFRRRRMPLMIGSIVAFCLLIIAMYGPGLRPSMVNMLLFLFGVFSSCEIICFAIGREHCPDNIAATAIATTNFLITLGAIIFQPLVGFLLDWGWQGALADGVRVYDIETFRMAYLILPLGMVVAAVLSTALTETYGKAFGARG